MKFVSFFCLTFLIIASALWAKNTNEKVEELSKYMERITTDTALGQKSITTTSAWPAVGENWCGSVDVLLWKPKIAGTAFATTNDVFDIDQPIQGSIKDNSLDWDMGLKVGLGKNLDYDAWSLFGEFTYFKTSSSSKCQGGAESAVIPLKGAFAQAAKRATSHIKFSFLNLDVELSRHYFISRTLALKPLFGIKNTWNQINQKVSFSEGSFLINNTATTIDTSKMWGIGPKAGFDTNWYLGEGFHGFGLFSASLLYSYFKVRYTSLITSTPITNVFLTQKDHQFIPTMQFNLGIGWSRYLNEQNNYLQIKLGYEAQYYWRLNQMLSLYEFKNTLRAQSVGEDVSMYGVTLQVQLFF